MVIPSRTLGNTNLKVCPLAYGTWGIGGGTDWAGSNDAAALSALSAALDFGVNLIDTAPVYGLGHSETLVGQALKGRRCDVILATKCGLVREGTWNVHNLTPSSVRREVEDSLRRLQTDYIDIYQLHYPDPKTPLSETLAELERLRQAGKIRFIGVCNFNAELLAQAARLCPICTVQNQYSLLCKKSAESVFETCKKYAIGFMGYGPLAGGILSGKYAKEPNLRRCDARRYFYKFYKGEAFFAASLRTGRLRALADKYKVSPAAVAINWSLNRPEVNGVLCGMRTPKQVQDNVQALTFSLTAEEVSFLNHG